MQQPIELRSDNAAGVALEVLAAVTDANTGSALAYGDDDVTAALQERIREVFEHPTARVFPVTSGTAGNALALAAMCPPWGAVICHDSAHILQSECAATSMFGGGLAIRGVPGDDYRVQPDTLTAALDAVRWGDPHHSQPAVLSLTQPSDLGTVYAPDEIASLRSIAATRGLALHLDGARFANAMVAVSCTPAEMSWKIGVDALTLGATKNGGLSAEAIVVFDDRIADELVYRTKRSGHVTSKMRFQSAQVLGYLADDCWLRMAAMSNATMAALAAGLGAIGIRSINRPAVNMVFVELDDAVADRLEAAGLLFYRIRPGVIRFVTSFQTTDDEISDALARIAAAL